MNINSIFIGTAREKTRKHAVAYRCGNLARAQRAKPAAEKNRRRVSPCLIREGMNALKEHRHVLLKTTMLQWLWFGPNGASAGKAPAAIGYRSVLRIRH
jgi:hypothetical protein